MGEQPEGAQQTGAPRLPVIRFKDGSEHTLKFDFWAWGRVGQVYGSLDRALMAGVIMGRSGQTLFTLLRFIWAGLLHEGDISQPKWSILQLAEQLDLTRRADYMYALAAAIETAAAVKSAKIALEQAAGQEDVAHAPSL